MADNVLALGKLVDAVSHSRYWQIIVIVVVEDDAQDGPDHVDAHRAPALVISPYTQTGAVDSTRYDTASTLATIEDLLGLDPMSVFDARANRMWPSFTKKPNLQPYDAIQPTITPFGDPGAPTNSLVSPLALMSSQMNFQAPDLAPEDLLSLAVWQSVKGTDVPMPAPRHTLVQTPSNANEAEDTSAPGEADEDD
jgi:hypothetical protein